MALEVETTIIGAGVVGLAIAAEMAERGRKVFVFEKNRDFGLETSSRNSEVIHSGIYYPQNTLKAKLCVEGRALLYELCEKYEIPYRKLGKMTVAIEDSQIKALEELYEQGKSNGVTDIIFLSREELKRLEPNVEARAAIFSPCTGILDSYALMNLFYTKAKENGAEFVFNSEVVGIEKKSLGYEVKIKDREGVCPFMTQMVVNSGGLYCDKIAELVGIDIISAGYQLRYGKGEYFIVNSSKRHLIKRLIYPIPKGTITGIHIILNLEGRMRIGPDTRYIKNIDYSFDETQKEVFYHSAKEFFPCLELDDLEPESTGIRAKLQGPGEPFRDFIITDEKERGLPGFINLIGIESPGLTAAPAIAKYVCQLATI